MKEKIYVTPTHKRMEVIGQSLSQLISIEDQY
jgi:hypothetical protein